MRTDMPVLIAMAANALPSVCLLVRNMPGSVSPRRLTPCDNSSSAGKYRVQRKTPGIAGRAFVSQEALIPELPPLAPGAGNFGFLLAALLLHLFGLAEIGEFGGIVDLAVFKRRVAH